jgi:hypothetical protein
MQRYGQGFSPQDRKQGCLQPRRKDKKNPRTGVDLGLARSRITFADVICVGKKTQRLIVKSNGLHRPCIHRQMHVQLPSLTIPLFDNLAVGNDSESSLAVLLALLVEETPFVGDLEGKQRQNWQIEIA